MARIFLCHASEDKAQVRDVYRRLRAIDGFEPWLDEEDLLPGQNWTREIPRVLQTSDFILVFFSRTSVAKRSYFQREMKLGSVPVTGTSQFSQPDTSHNKGFCVSKKGMYPI